MESLANADGAAKGRCWCFTLNNPRSQLTPDVDGWAASYVVWQLELSASGTLHYQGYIELTRQQRLSYVKKLAGLDGAHFEPRRGTPAEARSYCMKEDSRVSGPWEYGVFKNVTERKRTDLLAVKEAMDAGRMVTELKKDAAFFSTVARYEKFFKGYEADLLSAKDSGKYAMESFRLPRQDLTKSFVIHGKPGTGKTQYAMAHFKCPLVVTHMDQLANYQNGVHDGIVFDDMDFSNRPVESNIHLLDITQTSAQHIRYQVAMLPSGVPRIFTTNKEPLSIFCKEEHTSMDQRIALLRRFKYSEEITEPLFNVPIDHMNTDDLYTEYLNVIKKRKGPDNNPYLIKQHLRSEDAVFPKIDTFNNI